MFEICCHRWTIKALVMKCNTTRNLIPQFDGGLEQMQGHIQKDGNTQNLVNEEFEDIPGSEMPASVGKR